MQSMNTVLSTEQELDEALRHLSIVRMILMKYITLIDRNITLIDRIKETASGYEECGLDGIIRAIIEEIIREHFMEGKSK